MRAIITGASGLLGRRLVEKLSAPGALGGVPLELTLADMREPRFAAPKHAAITTVQCDLRDPAAVRRLVGGGADYVFHLAAVMSAAAEEDFHASWAINVTGVQNLLDALEAAQARPRFIYASSAAVYGHSGPDQVPDTIAIQPRSSYGAQKAVAELLIDDYTRRGLIDGWSLRLGHVVVRDDATHRGAGAFITAIVREPLLGNEAVCPVSPETLVGVTTPATVADSLMHAATLPEKQPAGTRAVQMPVLTVTIRTIVEAVFRVGGQRAVDLITWKHDAELEALLNTIPASFAARRAQDLGFPPVPNFHGVIAEYLESRR